MRRIRTRWALFFFGLILLPVALLTYSSVQSLQDEHSSVVAEQQLMALLLQDVFGDLAERIAQHIAYAPDPNIDLSIYDSFAEVDQAFALDSAGNPTYPLVLPLTLGQRRSDFDQALSRGQHLEFTQRDLKGAYQAYSAAWKGARSNSENAEVLNALGRCALAQKKLGTALELHDKLTFYNLSFDPDGAHPATLSHLRLASKLEPAQAGPMLAAWIQALLDGHYPLYPGCRTAIEQARQLAQTKETQDRQQLLANLDKIEERLDFTEKRLPKLASHIAAEPGYASGVLPQGASFLLYARPFDDNATLGLVFNLDALRQTIALSAAGQNLEERGFAFELFDVGQGPAFVSRRVDTIHSTAAASPWLDGMRLGVWAVDASSALDFYRKRNLAVATGIFLLVGFVALGGIALFRDTNREMHTARLRAEFVANVSHELRTPLTAIRMNAETLQAQRYHSEDKRDELLGRLVRESQRLSHLVDNILDFSRIESGRKTYAFRSCTLTALVGTALESYEAILQQQHIALTTTLPDDLPPLNADPEAIIAAISNLVGNGIKYSTTTKALNVEVRQQGAEQWVEVADRGIGVPPAERQRIFDKFYRAANAGDSAGTGVGLALVKSIAEAHQGRIEMEDRLGGGTIFRLILPQNRS